VRGRMANGEWRMAEGGKNDHDVSVFVGKKSPVTRSECLSVIRGNYQVGDAVVSIFAIGPKNMDYKKVISVFKNL